MSATLASRTWPQAAPSAQRFGRRIVPAGPEGQGSGVQWLMQRNCSITPRQLMVVFASLCALSSLIGAFFFFQGAPFVAAFAGVELLALGAALLVFARHAADREMLTLVGRSLRVEWTLAGRTERADLRADWLRVEPQAAQGSLVQLSGSGRTLHVGRFLRPELRGAFAQELRQALRHVRQGRAGTPTEHTENRSGH
jgi:uncharacterized membrane protein